MASRLLLTQMNDSGVAERGDAYPARPDKVRAFIALPIPEAVKDQIERVQIELRRVLPAKTVRLTKRDQFHLTLRFLGNVQADRLTELTDTLLTVTSAFPVLNLRAERVGCFPHSRFPRVLWIWVHDDAEQLPVLQRTIESAVEKFAESKADKMFTGHVTLARINGIKQPEAEALSKQMNAMTDRCFGDWTAKEVKLMRSELLQSGALHTVLAAFPLT